MKKKRFGHILLFRRVISRWPFKNLILKFFPLLYTIIESKIKFDKDVEFYLLPILCDKNRTSLDIGVLWGAYSYEMKKHSKAVLSYEPNIYMCQHVERAFSSGGVHIQNVGVSDHCGKMTLRIPVGSPGNSTLEAANPLVGKNNLQEIEVKVISIDSEPNADVGFVKVDIEGHEIHALQGMTDLLERCRPNILVEIEERHKKNSVSEVFDFFKDNQYDVYFVKDNSIINSTFFSTELQDTKYLRTRDYIKNFIAIHRDNSDSVLKEISTTFNLEIKS